MENLFSPWRSLYIKSFKEEVPEGEKVCPFCAALDGSDDRDTGLVYRGKTAFVIMNKFPYNAGHLMVIPNRHTSDLQSLGAEENAELMSLLQAAQHALAKLVHPHGYNLGMNLGRSGGAGIDDHLHWHIVPRWNGDTNFLPVLADVKLVSVEMSEQWVALHEMFPSIV
ncbi:MAG: HIT domain-containing protein [Candidatus Kapaibacterium sp.]|jgi:ATP adenylyltransferase